MAKLNKKLFGQLQGKFGDAVFRNRNGKNFVAQRPSEYTIPNNEAFQNRTATFRLSSKIASTINSHPLLKILWKNYISKGVSPYNYLLGLNYSEIEANSITGSIKIVPENGIGVRVNSSALADGIITITLNPLTANSTVDPLVEKKIRAVSLLFLSQPSSGQVDKYEIIIASSSPLTFDLDSNIVFQLPLSTANADIVNGYQSKRLFSTVITFNEDGIPVQYAKTFSGNL